MKERKSRFEEALTLGLSRGGGRCTAAIAECEQIAADPYFYRCADVMFSVEGNGCAPVQDDDETPSSFYATSYGAQPDVGW